MNLAFTSAINQLQEQIKSLEDKIRPELDEITAKKKLINQLCLAGGDQPFFANVEGDNGSGSKFGPARADQYFGQPLATVVKEILNPRESTHGAISLDDLYDLLKAGGYQFDNKNEQIAKRNVAITLGKNPAFMKVPNTGAWGLAAWYPGAKRNKAAATDTTTDVADTEKPLTPATYVENLNSPPKTAPDGSTI